VLESPSVQTVWSLVEVLGFSRSFQERRLKLSLLLTVDPYSHVIEFGQYGYA